ncbi:hypothetical protein Vadar_000432 [Vaccinium darrowii]|uniref:Uncharacterized protein n=1 Tax=Vaccinium darrowii TaxID=229202 RepID=A0ACB7Z8J5_9ERIC|nr:hypothetical protein Vadar_000432 [Vaccinium darrowii]
MYSGLMLSRSFMRIKVLVDTTKPLLRGFFYKRPSGGAANSSHSVWIRFKYERLSDFCFLCGRLGHEKSSCKFPPAVITGGDSYGHELQAASLRDMKPANSMSNENATSITISMVVPHISSSFATLLVMYQGAYMELFYHASESAFLQTAARHQPQERVIPNDVTPNLVVCNDAVIREGVRSTRGSHSEEHNDGIVSTSDRALSTPNVVSKPNSLNVSEGGLSINTSPQPMQANLQAQSLRPAYYVTEPPESPKGALALSKPKSYNPEPVEPNPTSSPRSIKQDALVDIILAHVFEDLKLKRKAPDEALDEEKTAKLQKALRQQIRIPVENENERGGATKCTQSPISPEKGLSQISDRRRIHLKKGPSNVAPAHLNSYNNWIISQKVPLVQEVVPIASDWTQLSQVPCTYEDEISVSPSQGGVVVVVPQQPQDRC